MYDAWKCCRIHPITLDQLREMTLEEVMEYIHYKDNWSY